LKKYSRKILLILVDIIFINLATFTALMFRFDGRIPPHYINILLYFFGIITILKIGIFYIFRLYNSLWKYASIDELLQIFVATLLGSTASYLMGYLSGMLLPISVYPISWLLTFMLVGCSRMSYRVMRRLKHKYSKDIEQNKKVMIVGAGEAGSMVIKELISHDDLKYIPVAVIDDAGWKHSNSIHGVPVVGGRDRIKESVEKYGIDEIIVAIPSVRRAELQSILKICKETKCKLKTLPGVYELIDNKVSIKAIRDVSIDDLLGRDEVHLNTKEISNYLTDEVVLVTGGGGSIGSELCRQIAKFNPKKLLVFDIYENNVYDLQNELKNLHKNKLDLEVLIGSVREKDRLRDVFDKYRPGVVFHAAAHKHVPLMEANPAEAIKNNVFGTLNTAQCADEFGAKRFVLISTDKAVNPTNVMGATKRIAEMIIQSIDKQSKTEFVAVRFGNVLGSNGSVIPLFKKQIAHGGPVTVTHPEITRFFMTIPEAAQLVIQAGAMAKGGEIFILDMGESVKIADLARDLIKLSGFEPDGDIKIEYTGLRPGEKLYEELLLQEEGIAATKHESIFVGEPLELSHSEVLICIKALKQCLHDGDSIRDCIAWIVPTYRLAEEEVAATR
jgi:FlaA1/EpsC-like NDP-sugar epimerase